MVAHQVRRTAESSGEAIDSQGFDLLLELEEERGLSTERILELQKQLGL